VGGRVDFSRGGGGGWTPRQSGKLGWVKAGFMPGRGGGNNACEDSPPSNPHPYSGSPGGTRSVLFVTRQLELSKHVSSVVRVYSLAPLLSRLERALLPQPLKKLVSPPPGEFSR